MITINQPDNASIRTGIIPVTNDPPNKYSKFLPDSDWKAIMLLSTAIMVTVLTVIIPFHFTLKNGISVIAKKITTINAIIISIR
jgi:hypothetical protein